MNYIVATLNERDPAPVHMENLLYFLKGFVCLLVTVCSWISEPSAHILWKKRQGSMKLRTYEQTGLEHAIIDEA